MRERGEGGRGTGQGEGEREGRGGSEGGAGREHQGTRREPEHAHAPARTQAELYLCFGGQISDAVRFEEGEVNHGLEQGDSLLRVTSLAQEVALLKKEC